MRAMIARLFLNHPRSVGESYGAHFWFAASMAARLFAAGGAAAAHAVLPFLFEKTASRMLRAMHRQIENR